jgi:hypothetical protein
MKNSLPIEISVWLYNSTIPTYPQLLLPIYANSTNKLVIFIFINELKLLFYT